MSARVESHRPSPVRDTGVLRVLESSLRIPHLPSCLTPKGVRVCPDRGQPTSSSVVRTGGHTSFTLDPSAPSPPSSPQPGSRGRGNRGAVSSPTEGRDKRKSTRSINGITSTSREDTFYLEYRRGRNFQTNTLTLRYYRQSALHTTVPLSQT